jgi:hypothetical protein
MGEVSIHFTVRAWQILESTNGGGIMGVKASGQIILWLQSWWANHTNCLRMKGQKVRHTCRAAVRKCRLIVGRDAQGEVFGGGPVAG